LKMKTKIAHIQINVSDFEKSKKFYSELFGILGWKKLSEFNESQKIISFTNLSEDFSFWIFETEKKFEENKFHRKNTGLNHIAFRVNSKEEVDEFFNTFLKTKKENVLYKGPREYPEYVKGDYAVFFEYPDRIKLKVVYHP